MIYYKPVLSFHFSTPSPFPLPSASQACSLTTCILYPIPLPFPSSTHTSRFPHSSTYHSSSLAPSLRTIFLPPSPNILPSSFLLPLHSFPHLSPSPPVSLPSSFPPDTPLLCFPKPRVSIEVIG